MKLPVPTKEDIINWVTDSYNRISEESVKKKFPCVGYKLNDNATAQQIQQTPTSLSTHENIDNVEGLTNFHDLYLHSP
jgi:hypothetical protein